MQSTMFIWALFTTPDGHRHAQSLVEAHLGVPYPPGCQMPISGTVGLF